MPLNPKLLGQRDSRGMQGIFSRGKNVYHAGSSAAHSGGGPQFGRPRTVGARGNPGDPNTPRGQGPGQGNPGDNPYMAAIRRRLMRGQRGSHS